MLAKLHLVDPAAIGLADYGKPGNYFARQVARWSRQWEASRTRENPALDRLIAWLPAHIPGPWDETVVCRDFRIGNLMFDPVEPRVIAILDWELSTLGHPLADSSKERHGVAHAARRVRRPARARPRRPGIPPL